MSAAFDLNITNKGLTLFESEMLDQIILEGLQLNALNNYDILKEYEEEVGKGFDLDKALTVKHVKHFDEYFLAPINGFKNRFEFYDYYSGSK